MEREEYSLILIASENYVAQEILDPRAPCSRTSTPKGTPTGASTGAALCGRHRAGGRRGARELFGAEHVDVQPRSGSSANMAVLFAVLQPGDKILGMDLAHGGRPARGAPTSFSVVFFRP